MLTVFAAGEAFQFDWSCEYAVIAGQGNRFEVARVKLASSRALWFVTCLSQSHEMLFDAPARAFDALGGIPESAETVAVAMVTEAQKHGLPVSADATDRRSNSVTWPQHADPRL